MIEVNGAPGTLYANEVYQLQVDFPENYPMEAPQVCVIDPILSDALCLFDEKIAGNEKNRKLECYNRQNSCFGFSLLKIFIFLGFVILKEQMCR